MMPELAAWLGDIPIMSPLAFALIGLAGLVMGVAPSSLPLIGAAFGYVASDSKQSNKTRGLRLAFGLVLGMATVDAIIGGLFGLLGFAVLRVLASYLALTNLVFALLLLVLGLALLRKIRIPMRILNPTFKKVDSVGGAYGLGAIFGLSTCPVCTPMILPVLGAAAATGEPWLGAALLFTFGIARGIPILVAGTAAGALKRLEHLASWVPIIERTGGGLLLIAAFYFLYQSAVYKGWLPPLWATTLG